MFTKDAIVIFRVFDVYIRVVTFEQPFTTIFVTTFFFLTFYWLKTMEKKRKRENKNIMWVWERKLSRSCHKI